MIQTWWIRRWYFLYISVCMVSHIVALFESFQFETYDILYKQHTFHETLLYKRLILYKLFLHGYSVNHALFSYLYISSDLIVFQMIYKTKQITRFMTKHFLKHKSWIPFSQNQCISQAFLCWRTYFHMCFQEMMHRTYQDILRRTCALVT